MKTRIITLIVIYASCLGLLGLNSLNDYPNQLPAYGSPIFEQKCKAVIRAKGRSNELIEYRTDSCFFDKGDKAYMALFDGLLPWSGVEIQQVTKIKKKSIKEYSI